MSSYFLPGKVERQNLLFLIDTGCNTNLLSKKVFDRMPRRVKMQLEENDQYGLMVDGSKLQFYGLIRLSGKIRDVPIKESFIVSQISKDAILGMPFLISHNCNIEFGRPVISLEDRKHTCMDKHGRLMVSKVYTWKKVTIPLYQK
ncbi:retroviral-like aspartic protease 1 [Watersipora subatra]|uniref:retroviral-like aspartic protease 1 n=1 Tax=Watersipora subatra TaxID=2589382 RepID=UPI00355B3E42